MDYSARQLQLFNRIAVIYFALLGTINLIATFLNASVRVLDFWILIVLCLPCFINSKIFKLFFGVAFGVISLSIFLYCFNLSLANFYSDLIAGFLLSLTMMAASFLMTLSSKVFTGDNAPVGR